MMTLSIAAWSEAAGRPNNEDSFAVGKNLSTQDWAFTTNEVIDLDEKGALLVVCDGMGGMNAGEVASAIAVATVKALFTPERLTDEIIASPETIRRYIQKTIIAADAKIKEEAARDSDKEGMGSTIVLAWLVGQSAYIGWCGDSRAYRYNPALGLERLSHDHSYVQELVDAGKLSAEMAMQHPKSNIITRSLGDNSCEAQPEILRFPLYTGDVVLLCSDGLCGIMQDAEIESAMAKTPSDMRACRDVLLSESEKKGWQDNVTLALCGIVSGGEKAPKKTKPAKTVSRKKFTAVVTLLALLSFLLILIAFGGGYLTATRNFSPTATDSLIIQQDSVMKPDTINENNGTTE